MIAATLNAAPPPRGDRRDVESFYHLSDRSLSGKACNGTACFVARHLNPRRWADAQQQTPRVYCLGQCFCAPAVCDSSARPHIESRSAHPIILKRLVKGGARTLTDYQLQGGYRAFQQALRQSPEDLLKMVEASELRGRGGAGFPVGRKWRAAASQQTETKFIIVNADEGDAGAYIDRFLLEDDPHAVIEGMLIAAYATGATNGWIYVRSEYPKAKPILEAALSEARRAGFLGKDVLGAGRGFDIEIHVGGGS